MMRAVPCMIKPSWRDPRLPILRRHDVGMTRGVNSHGRANAEKMKPVIDGSISLLRSSRGSLGTTIVKAMAIVEPICMMASKSHLFIYNFISPILREV